VLVRNHLETSYVEVPRCISAFSCDKGWGDCDGDLKNECETDLTTRRNCGACGMQCPTWDWMHFCAPSETSAGGYACQKLNNYPTQ
jgi:hypothetical protein